MSKLYDIILSYLALKRIAKSGRIANKCDKVFKKNLKVLEKRKKELVSIRKRLDSVIEVATTDLEEATYALGESKEALEAVQSEKKIAHEITIPFLVQSNKLLLERASADTAEQVRRQVKNTVIRKEE